MGTIASLAACAAMISGTVGAGDQALKLVSWGGAYMDAQRRALFTPFEKRFGEQIVAREYRGDLALLRSQQAAGRVEWDVVAVDEQGADAGCGDGLFETRDAWQPSPGFDDTPPQDDFLPAALHPCALGASVRSLVFFYLDDAFADARPARIADVFDPESFPGKRALPRTPRGNLEWALMADGVPPAEVYAELERPGGTGRAFARLTALRPHIVWWRRVTDAVRLLTEGTVSLAASHHDAVAQLTVGTPVSAVAMWSGQLWEIDYWAVVKHAPRAALARRFVEFATGTLQQAEFARLSSHGPVRSSALRYTQTSVNAWLPNAGDRLHEGLRVDAAFWKRNGAQIEEEFRAWWQSTR